MSSRKSLSPSAVAALLLRLVVAGTFVAAGYLKFQDPAAFAEQIANYQFMPEWSYLLATIFPPLELIAAVTLVIARRYFRVAASVVVFAMLLAFTTALVRAWALDINLECGCFGQGSPDIGIWPVLRNLGLMAALGLDFLLTRRETLRTT
jgi:uncharacterized membrane protein YphA (DoxX/SURF4 family)